MNSNFKNRKIKFLFSEDIEPHEILLDKLAKKKEEEFGISEKKFEVPLLKKILLGLFYFCILLILILFIRIFQLQAIEGENWLNLSKENKFIISKIQAERGVIYDRNLKQLVFNQPSFDLVCEKNNLPQDISEKERILDEVSIIIKKDIGDLKKEIENSTENILVISENLSHQELIILESKIKELPGFRINNNAIRDYRDGENFAHLIGYTNKIRAEELKASPEFYSIFDYVGREGVEKSYEEVLRKNPGKMRIERDALGNVISKEIVSLPESGKSLVLWLDSDLQRKINEELEKKLKELNGEKAVAVALDPKTGGVLSLVSLPNFDNNLFQKGSDAEELEKLLKDPFGLQPLFNRAISGQYPIGSTIKPLIATAALEEKIISPEKNISCQGLIEIPHRYISEIVYKYKDWKIHGLTNLRKAIAESCNVYFYTIGGGYGNQEGLGPSRIKKYLELFGWGEKTGIDIPGETKGLVPSPEWKKRVIGEDWWDGNTYHLSIGQEYILTTPLQVATAFSAIANGGKLFKPQVVQKIVDAEKSVIKEFEPEVIRELPIDPKNLQIVREGMRQAVTAGSATGWLDGLPVSVAAKTGTAELGNDYYHNWVTIFAPYENPQIILTIMLEKVKGVQAAVLPIAKAVLEWYFSQKGNI